MILIMVMIICIMIMMKFSHQLESFGNLVLALLTNPYDGDPFQHSISEKCSGSKNSPHGVRENMIETATVLFVKASIFCSKHV